MNGLCVNIHLRLSIEVLAGDFNCCQILVDRLVLLEMLLTESKGTRSHSTVRDIPLRSFSLTSLTSIFTEAGKVRRLAQDTTTVSTFVNDFY